MIISACGRGTHLARDTAWGMDEGFYWKRKPTLGESHSHTQDSRSGRMKRKWRHISLIWREMKNEVSLLFLVRSLRLHLHLRGGLLASSTDSSAFWGRSLSLLMQTVTESAVSSRPSNTAWMFQLSSTRIAQLALPHLTVHAAMGKLPCSSLYIHIIFIEVFL